MTVARAREILMGDPGLLVSPRGRLVATVKLGDRHQKVRVERHQIWWRVRSRVARIDHLDRPPSVKDLMKLVLRTNERTELVRLGRVDDALVVVHDVPVVAKREELIDAVWRVARAADRLELLWTGEDVE